ncbi:MAG TPA: sigma-54 dependent transcriptional regulator [Polyangiaceae bacterium]|nr:sigma-54 dependent transcriptional regulator [Polyangiaceae bacterium]
MRVLVLDDQRSARRVLKHLLSAMPNLELIEAASVQEAKDKTEAESPDAMLLDIRLSDEPTDRGGLDFLKWVRASGRTTPAIMITASTELAEIREAMRQGATDYVLKDELGPEMLLPIMEGIREKLELRGQVRKLREHIERDFGPQALVGASPAMERVRRLVARLADADAPVLIRGETGSGKEMVARAIHHSGARSSEPFVAVNCSALPGSLIESLIFGHQRGAFTGAVQRMRGQLELAGSGTLLLDEIAEMPIELQAKLLRVLEDRRFRPLGAEEELPLKARVLAATHVDLERRIGEGTFREDLYYRLNVVTIEVPTLHDRDDDIDELLHSFSSSLARRLRFSEEAMVWIRRRRWPGNVRELRNAVERLSLLAETDLIDVATLDELIGENAGHSMREIDKMARAILALPDRLGSKLDVIERAVLHHAVEMCSGNKSAAARLLGVHRKSLDRKLDRLSDPELEGEPE